MTATSWGVCKNLMAGPSEGGVKEVQRDKMQRYCLTWKPTSTLGMGGKRACI